MLNNDKKDDLKDLFSLFSRVDDSLSKLASEFIPFIADNGKAIVKEESKS